MVDRLPLGVVWEGSFFVHHSLANVNCEVAVLLAGDGRHRPRADSLRACTGSTSRSTRAIGAIAALLEHRPAKVHCHVRHRWPPDFTRPAQGAFVLVQPWEYGWLPVEWVNAIADTVDEVWVHSTFVRDVYVRSGVESEKVTLIPLGVNPAALQPSRRPDRREDGQDVQVPLRRRDARPQGVRRPRRRVRRGVHERGRRVPGRQGLLLRRRWRRAASALVRDDAGITGDPLRLRNDAADADRRALHGLRLLRASVPRARASVFRSSRRWRAGCP